MDGDRLARAALIAAVLGGGLLALALVWGRPRLIATGWLLAVFFLPVWLGITIVIGFEPATYAGIPAAAALLVSCRPIRPTPLTLLDVTVVGVFALCLLCAAFGGLTLEETMRVILKWGLGYLLGRIMLARVEASWLYGTIAVLLGIVSALAVVEFITSVNPFVTLPALDASAYAAWGELQVRGGLLRAEASFGHSIALGCSLALSVPLLLTCRLRGWLRGAIAAVLAMAIVFTFSRIGLIVAAVAVVLTVLSPRAALTRSWRIGILALLGVAAATLAPFVAAVFDDAGSEAADSAQYRDRLWELLPTVNLIGKSSAAYLGPSGTQYFGQFRSIDNAVLLFAMTYGWLPLLLLAVLYAGAVLRLCTGRYLAPVASVVSLLPALLSVALITQYEVIVWFFVGMACAAVAQDHAARQPTPADVGADLLAPRPHRVAS